MYKTKCECGGTYYLSQATATFSIGEAPVHETYGTYFCSFSVDDFIEETAQCIDCENNVDVSSLLIDDVVALVTHIQSRSPARDVP